MVREKELQMNDELERAIAEKLIKALDGQDPRVVYKALMYATLSVMVHEAKDVGDANISWPDRFRVISNNYLQQLKQHAAKTISKNEFQVSGNLIHLPGRGVQ